MCNTTSPTTATPSFFFGLPVAPLSEEIKEQNQLLKQQQPVELHLDTIASTISCLDDSISQLSSFKSMAPLKCRRTTFDIVLNNSKSSTSTKHSQLRRRALRAMELAAEQNDDEQQQQQKSCSTDTISTSSGEERVQVRFAPSLVTQLWEPDNYIDDVNRNNLFYSKSEMKQFRRDAIEAECKAEAMRVQREIAEKFEMDDELQAELLLCADISSRNILASTAA